MIGKSARILAVDDEKDFVQTLSEILTRLEYDVHTSCSGQEALQLMSLHPFDSRSTIRVMLSANSKVLNIFSVVPARSIW